MLAQQFKPFATRPGAQADGDVTINAGLQIDAVSTQICLVSYQRDFRRVRALLEEFGPQCKRVCCLWCGRIHHQQNPVSFADGLERALHADHFHLVLSIPQPCCVHDVQGHSIYVDMFTQYIAGCAGDLGDNCRLPARQSVQQTGFARIGTSGNHNGHAVA